MKGLIQKYLKLKKQFLNNLKEKYEINYLKEVIIILENKKNMGELEENHTVGVPVDLFLKMGKEYLMNK